VAFLQKDATHVHTTVISKTYHVAICGVQLYGGEFV